MGSRRAFMVGLACVVPPRRPPPANPQIRCNDTSAAKRLISAPGVPPDAPKALGVGPASPAASAGMDEGWAKNRPVQLVKQGSRLERMGEP
jgi:hypothetical protein